MHLQSTKRPFLWSALHVAEQMYFYQKHGIKEETWQALVLHKNMT